MATWLEGLPRRSTNPPSRQSVAKNIDGGMPQHAIAQVPQIGGAGTEISIVGTIERRDLRGKRCAPRAMRGLTAGDQRERGLG
jgi:hypothetical protein